MGAPKKVACNFNPGGPTTSQGAQLVACWEELIKWLFRNMTKEMLTKTVCLISIISERNYRCPCITSFPLPAMNTNQKCQKKGAFTPSYMVHPFCKVEPEYTHLIIVTKFTKPNYLFCAKHFEKLEMEQR